VPCSCYKCVVSSFSSVATIEISGPVGHARPSQSRRAGSAGADAAVLWWALAAVADSGDAPRGRAPLGCRGVASLPRARSLLARRAFTGADGYSVVACAESDGGPQATQPVAVRCFSSASSRSFAFQPSPRMSRSRFALTTRPRRPA